MSRGSFRTTAYRTPDIWILPNKTRHFNALLIAFCVNTEVMQFVNYVVCCLLTYLCKYERHSGTVITAYMHTKGLLPNKSADVKT
jgi:hypothetical protein